LVFVPYPVKFAKILRLSGREIYRRKTAFRFPKKKDGTYRWVRSVKSELPVVPEDRCEGYEVIKVDGGVLRVEDMKFYDFRPPAPSFFPTRYHDLTLCDDL